MPGFIGRKLCAKLHFIKPNFDKYRESSDIFRNIVAEFDPGYESQGLDEANLDLTEYLIMNNLDNNLGRIFIATKIRQEIFYKLRMTASCGIGCNRMLAKICSDLNKPNGQTVMPNDEA
jgi:DNA polymerase kappa